MIKITSLNKKGYGVGQNENGRTIKVWNSLPDEEVEIEITKKRKKEGRAVEILKTSSMRVNAEEPDHFLSCSPWQIMSIDYENSIKQKIITELFLDLYDDEISIESLNSSTYNYRNKIEFSFFGDENGKISLAFHKRGSKKGKYLITGCKLAENIINEDAEEIINWINTLNIEARGLKTLILRSNGNNECISALFVKNSEKFEDLVKNLPNVKNFSIYFSDPKSPASKPTKLLYTQGEKYLETELNEIKMRFGLNSFFQINIPVFKLALDEISKYIDINDEVIDYYSGVGSISLALHKEYLRCKLIEVNDEAVNYANINIKNNNIENCSVICARSEEELESIKPHNVLILDPPREGLHPKFLQKLIEIKPKKIIYLSCNPETQHRDILMLSMFYKLEFVKVFNFFPRTPHIENLCLLTVI